MREIWLTDGKCFKKLNWPGLPAALPSPASPSAVIVSPETLSRNSSTSPSRTHTVGQFALALPCPPRPIPAVCYPAPTFIEVADDANNKHLGAYALATTLSALYGKLLVVMGIAFPMSEVISSYIPPSFYEAFYLYLYFGSMIFLLCMHSLMLIDGKPKQKHDTKEISDLDSSRSSSGAGDSDSPNNDYNPSISKLNQHYGSFYLRMGAVAFGIGSMIYSGLEFGQYFELERNTKCHNIMLALTPATRMAFIFIQMYFIFLNNQQMKVSSHRLLARFGLMHMIGTNLSVWLNVLVQETKHEILTFYNPENNSLKISHRLGAKGIHLGGHTHSHHGENVRVSRGLKGPHHMFECRRTNIMGSLVQDASPFLFPCTIEYSLICAAILYVMWKNIAKQRSSTNLPTGTTGNHVHAHAYRRSPHYYSVDCARAHKGLFVGILILVLTIISLILFFVLISRSELVSFAVTEVNVCELTLYGMSTVATLIGMIQMRRLRYDGARNLELDNILLIAAQTGMFIYSTFTIISGYFTLERNTILVLVTALASVIQTTFQTIFILDASRRSVSSPEQIRRKPGREIVTFLLVTNLAMWAINTLEKSRAESHPIQLHFYGLWAWTIITHVSMPLAIFYRFHSTVCLCEVWKRAYKVKPTYI
ncbi:proton channel OtopLc-like [Cotesia typhae]|uniref:proton channel OtopLc-like n=1 Tax=Cotesia typhae TaxID=2053667 RepID=UPI003D6977F0